MNVVILHCHFERGGVTQVVENHLRALREVGLESRVALASGGRNSGLSPTSRNSVDLIRLKYFDYDVVEPLMGAADRRASVIAEDLIHRLEALGYSSTDTVLHWHNHSLGKHTGAPGVIAKLARMGWRLLLQIHDFAEDDRPENYARLIAASGAKERTELDRYLYPVADQIHYAALTGADAACLVGFGIPEPFVHVLPNSVTVADGRRQDREEALLHLRRALGLPASSRWCLYPVRGIRRKNVGEFLLLSRWTIPNTYSGITLPPATEIEALSYNRWKLVAREVAPRAVFDAGLAQDLRYSDSIAASEFVISTSVAEGFGMAFLEPWLAGRRVIARRIASTIEDFEHAGVDFPGSYCRVPIPGSEAWLREVRAETFRIERESWQGVPECFRPPIREHVRDDDSTIDFAMLTPRRQVEVLRRLVRDPIFETDIRRSCEPWLSALRQPGNDGVIRSNAAVIADRYSLFRQGKDLLAIYRGLLSVRPSSTIAAPDRAGTALERIRLGRPFYPCRTESIDDIAG